MALQDISHYFGQHFLDQDRAFQSLGEEFTLCDNGNMVFHWADFYETCDFIKERIKKDTELEADFKRRKANLERLDLIPVWIRTENKIHQSTMHGLYEKYILNQLKAMSGIDPLMPLEISFISGTGPYKELSIAECFNKATYLDFILIYLLENKIPRRDFRIRLKSKVLMEFGANYSEAGLVSLEQLTTSGILLSVDAEAFDKKLARAQDVRILLDTKVLEEGLSMGLDELKSHLSHFTFNLLYSSQKEDAVSIELCDLVPQSSFDFSQNKRIIFFVPYERLSESRSGHVKVIREFVAHTKDLIRNFYQRGDRSQSA